MPRSAKEIWVKVIHRIRYSRKTASWLRALKWRALGAKMGSGCDLARFELTWPSRFILGSKSIVCKGVLFKIVGWSDGPAIVIAEDTYIGHGCEFNISCSITIGAHCMIASGCKFIDENHSFGSRAVPLNQQPSLPAPIVIEDDVWLGSNVLVLQGVTIGKGAVIGAGAVVTKSVPTYEIWAGIPAKKISERPE